MLLGLGPERRREPLEVCLDRRGADVDVERRMAGVVEPSGKTTDDDEVDAVLVERTAHAAIRTSSTSSSATVAHQSVTLCFEPSPVSLIEGSLPLGQDLVVPVLLGELHP